MDKNVETRKNEHHQALWILSILALAVLISLWVVPSFSNLFNTKEKIEMTITLLLILPIAWVFFYKQKGLDEGKDSGKGLATKVFYGTNVFSGVGYGFNAIRGIIGSVVLIIGGIFLLIFGEGIRWAGAVFVVLGLLMIIYIKNSITLAKGRMHGRAY